MHQDKIKDEFIRYWNEHYHNAVMPIQKKHELKKVAWEFWKESNIKIYDELDSQMQNLIKKLSEQKIEINDLTKQNNEFLNEILETRCNNKQRKVVYISNNELEKKNQELWETIKDKDQQLNNWFLSYNEVVRENEELKTQIEKMKNVGNCKHTMQCSEWVEHKIKEDGIKSCLNCNNWELAK